MSKIEISVDTAEKTFVVMIDGKELDCCTSVNLYKGIENDDYFSCTLSTCEMPENKDDLRSTTYLTAKESSNAEEIQDSRACESKDGFITYKESDLSSAMSKVLSRYL